MINCRSALRGRFTIAAVVISLFTFMFAVAGCEIQDLGITESAAPPAAPPQDEVSFSVSSQSSVPANPPAWSATTLYNRAGMYVTHKGKVWVSQWSVTLGAEPGANSWNGWKSAVVLSKDAANPQPWDANGAYNAKGFYVSHKGKVWVSQWHITRGQEPGANTWNGWKEASSLQPEKKAAPAWTRVFGGSNHMLAVSGKGHLYAWGRNEHGQLGDGSTTDRLNAVRIGTASDWDRIGASSSAYGRSIGINKKGELYVWGGTGSKVPARVGDSSDWVHAAGGGNHILAINSRGELYGWGSNRRGQLGMGIDRPESVSAPTRIGTAANWKHADAGLFYSLAINDDGELYAWGYNYEGQLGIGSSASYTVSPQRVGTASNWVHVDAGVYHALGVNSLGELYVWGKNDHGQLGNGGNTSLRVPTRIATSVSWKYVSAGNAYSMAISDDGALYAWGRNDHGQLGDGKTADRSTPTKIGDASNWSDVSAGVDSSRALNAEGELYAWGRNDYGQLGDGKTADRSTPVKIAAISAAQ